MSDAAAFSATYADWKLVKTRSVVQIVFEAPIEREAEVYAVLGGMPRAAEERWFAIARLNIGGTRQGALDRTKPGQEKIPYDTGEAASDAQRTARPLLSNKIYLRICNNPKGRRFLEEFCQDICKGEPVNDPEFAKDIIKRRLGIASLSFVDSDPVSSEHGEQLLGLFAGWERGYAA